MTTEIMHHLAAAGRMADVNRILEVEMIGDGLQIVGIVVHVVPAAGLSRATMSAPISCNDVETFADEKKHLRVPIIGRQRPAVAEHDGLTFAPILIVDVDVGSLFFSDSYVWHGICCLVPGLMLPAGLYLRQKPGAALRRIDPNFNQTGCGDVTMLVTYLVRLPQSRGQRLGVLCPLVTPAA